MTDDDPNRKTWPQYRCLIHGNWDANSYFKHCPICHEECDLINETNHDEVYNWGRSKTKEAELYSEQKATEAQAALDANLAARRATQDLDRVIRNATTALNFDLDRWLEASPDELR